MKKVFRHKKRGVVMTQKTDIMYWALGTEFELPAWVIENSNDWEEVEQEKEWEVVKFRNRTCFTDIRYRDGAGKVHSEDKVRFSGITQAWEEYGTNKDNFDIYAVKRLSDGTVFTVGEKVRYKSGFTCPISKFSVRGTDIFVNEHFGSHDIAVKQGNYEYLIQHWDKIEPLFYTEDKVPIYSGDRYWYLLQSGNRYEIFECSYAQEGHGLFSKNFSTRAAAEKWVEENRKPLLITEDGVPIYDESTVLYVLLTKASWTTASITVRTYRQKVLSNVWKLFSTEEARTEYEIRHRPMLSLHEIEEISKNPYAVENFDLESVMKALTDVVRIKYIHR